MNASATPSDSATHKVVDALLPWFVNGTLDGDERRLVERHLGECTECEAQARWLRDLHAACVAGSAQPGTSPVFERVRRDLGSSAGRRGQRPRRAIRRILPWAAAAAVLVVAAGYWQLEEERPNAFRTLGATERALPSAQPRLVVVFDPATPEADVRRILRAVGARIVDGPTAANGYVLEAAGAQQANALSVLRSERAVVLAQPLGEARGR
jgi:hypothetical protein